MKKKHIKNVLVILLIVGITAAVAAVIVLNGLGITLPGVNQTTAATPNATQGTTAESDPPVIATAPVTEPAIETLEFPIVLENGRLQIESLFSYTGMNPDDENQEVKNIAAITLVNCSGEYLAEATVTLTLGTGDVTTFQITDVPAGRRVIAFSADSAEATENTGCTAASCEAVFDGAATMYEDRIAVSVEGMSVKVQNLTGSEISELVIYCRCPLGEDFFGGITYQYPITSLPANGSTTVDAWDCVLGMAEVVRIEINE